MKTVIYTSLSLNGQVLLAANSDQQISQEILADFIQHARQSGNLIIGRNTAELMLDNPKGLQALTGVDVVVISAKAEPVRDFTVVSSPEDAQQYLAKKGYDKALVGGGVTVYNSFLTRKLVNELIINVNPLLTGNGGLLLHSTDEDVNLQFSEVRKLTEQIVQCRHIVSR